MSELYPCRDGLEDHQAVECDNCEWTGTLVELGMIRDFQLRVSPGEPCPAGQCPACSCLAHLKKCDWAIPEEKAIPEPSDEITLIRCIANLTKNGEEVEGVVFVMPAGDAISSVNSLIDWARRIVAEKPDPEASIWTSSPSRMHRIWKALSNLTNCAALTWMHGMKDELDKVMRQARDVLDLEEIRHGIKPHNDENDPTEHEGTTTYTVWTSIERRTVDAEGNEEHENCAGLPEPLFCSSVLLDCEKWAAARANDFEPNGDLVTTSGLVALKAILGGSIYRGRWLNDGEAFDDNEKAIGSIESEPPEDYPDAEWFPYTEEEQSLWLETVADTARTAIAYAEATVGLDAADIEAVRIQGVADLLRQRERLVNLIAVVVKRHEHERSQGRSFLDGWYPDAVTLLEDLKEEAPLAGQPCEARSGDQGGRGSGEDDPPPVEPGQD